MPSTMIMLLILTYVEVGIAIGLQELGCTPQASTAFSRRGPFRHVVLQCLLWPLLFLVVKSANFFEKILKLTITICVVFFAQKYAVAWLLPKMGLWAWLPTCVGGVLVVLSVFAFLRMPGFRPQF